MKKAGSESSSPLMCPPCPPAVMASAASPKRMVSSVFITLAPPCRATVTPQQSAVQAPSTAAREPPRPAARVGPGDDVCFARPQAESLQGPDSRGRPGTGSWSKALHLQSSRPPEVNKGALPRQNKAAGTWKHSLKLSLKGSLSSAAGGSLVIRCSI